MRQSLFAVCVVVAASASPVWAQDYSYEQERYCTGDAFRLCGSEIPDVSRITACMVRRQAELSPACRAVFGPPRAPVARAPAMRERPRMAAPAPLPPPPVFDDYDRD